MLRRGEGEIKGGRERERDGVRGGVRVEQEERRTGRMLRRGEGEVGRTTGGGEKKKRGDRRTGGTEGWREGAAICQTRQTCPSPPSNLRYSVCLFSALI